MPSNTIRLATHADHDAVVACIQAAFTPWIPIIGMEPLALSADYRDFIARKITHIIDGDQAGDVAGILIIVPEEAALYIDTIAVHPAYQKHGLGRRLMDYAAQQALEKGFKKLTLITNAKQLSNQDYYRKYGFVETRRAELRPGRVGVWMAKTLAE